MNDCEAGARLCSAERNKVPNQPIGTIPVDSIFSPIRKVNFLVEDTRVGQVTDTTSTLEVWTDGSIKPDEAVSQAARILSQRIAIFIDLSKEEEKADTVEQKVDETGRRSWRWPLKSRSLGAFVRCLKRRHQYRRGTGPQDRGRDDESAQPREKIL